MNFPSADHVGAQCRAQVGLQQLDRDVPVVTEIEREIHRGHAAGPDFPLDPVTVGEGCREVREKGCRSVHTATGGLMDGQTTCQSLRTRCTSDQTFGRRVRALYE